MNAFISKHYGLHPLSWQTATLGVGGESRILHCEEGMFVIKFPCATAMDHPEAEPALCAHLRKKGIPACEFLQNREGRFLSEDENGRLFHIKKYVPGRIFAPHTAPDWLMDASADMLGRIHVALADYPALPEGIGAGFFRHMTPEAARASYRHSLSLARAAQDRQAEEDLRFRLSLAERLGSYPFEALPLTLVNTHGDYTIHQLICGENKLSSVLDWTCACVHPAVWEVIRSFLLAHPGARNGSLDAAALKRYLSIYGRHMPLSREDRAQMLPLIFYQLTVCDYWGQYFASSAANRTLFREQAHFFTLVLRSMDQCMEPLTEILLQET